MAGRRSGRQPVTRAAAYRLLAALYCSQFVALGLAGTATVWLLHRRPLPATA